MARRKQLGVVNFKGIDRRRKIQSTDPQNLWDAANLDLTRGGELRARDSLELVTTLPDNTLGLYTNGGVLRCAVPAGNGIEALAPVGFRFDAISHASGAISLNRYIDIQATTNWDAGSDGEPLTYLVAELSGGRYEHHYLDGSTITRVALPFSPGKDVVTLQNKIYAADTHKGTVHFSSTQFGPRFWNYRDADANGYADAGFIDAVNNSKGTTNIQGLTFYNSQLAIFFPDSVQFWQVDEDPNNFILLRTLDGPGTTYFSSVSSVISDLHYFSYGGFHSLQATNVLGEQREGDIGAAIKPFTDMYEAGGYDVKAFWSPSRSQYLCFFSDGSSTRVFCRTISPLGGVDGWTYWDLDVPVDNVTELGGRMYIRSGNDVYKFVQNEVGDDLDFTWNFESGMLDGNKASMTKQWNSIDFEQEGTIDTVEFRVDTQDPSKTFVAFHNVEGSTSSLGRFPICALSNKIGIKCSGSKWIEHSGFILDYLELTGA